VAAVYPGATPIRWRAVGEKDRKIVLFKFAEVRKEKTYSTSRPGYLFVNVELQDDVKKQRRVLG